MICGLSAITEFIKKGRNSATVEITLVNKGDTAYKPEVYGDTIVVVRTIGTSSSYKIKNWKGTWNINFIFNDLKMIASSVLIEIYHLQEKSYLRGEMN